MSKNKKFAVHTTEAGDYDSYRFETFKEAEDHVKNNTYRFGNSCAVFAMISKSKSPVAVTSIEMEKVEIAKV